MPIGTPSIRTLQRPVRSAQHVSIRYADRLPEEGTVPADDRVGDSYGNALPETIDGLYKSEIIHSRSPWRNFEPVEYATLKWVA